MAVALYMDAHIPRAITLGLRMRTVDVLTAQEDGAGTLPDPALLERATQLGRVLFTFDDDLLLEAVKRQAETKPFSGVIYFVETEDARKILTVYWTSRVERYWKEKGNAS